MPKLPLLGKRTVRLLKAKRTQLGLTESEVAKKIGCRTTKVVDVEERNIGLKTKDLKKWAFTYKIRKSIFINSIIEDQREELTKFFRAK